MSKVKRNGGGGGSGLQPPIPFVTVDSGGVLHVNDQAASLLANLPSRKVCVIMVAGPARTGKSFLLNRLVGDGPGFEVGDTVRSCTKGIWLWGSPIIGDDGRAYVYMDTEGLGSIEQSKNYDNQLFSLALLLSSTFILNTQGTINEGTLEQLQLVCECAKTLVDSQGEAAEAPSLIWVLRDFMLKLENENGEMISATDYLETALQPQSGSAKRVKEKNELRATLRSFFKDRAAVTLIRPVADEDMLQRLNSVPWDGLRPEFRKALDGLRRHVHLAAKVKSIGGELVDGAGLVHLAKMYADAINHGTIPVIHNAWDTVVEATARRVSDEAGELYEGLMASGLKKGDSAARGGSGEPLVHEASFIEAVHNEAAAAVRALVASQSLGSDEVRASLLAHIEGGLAARLAATHAANVAASRAGVSRLVDGLWQHFGLDTPSKDAAATAATHKAVLEAYSSQAVGPAVGEGRSVLAARLESRWAAVCAAVAESARVKEAAAIERADRAEARVVAAEEAARKATHGSAKLEAQLSAANERAARAEAKVAAAEETTSKALQEAARLEASLDGAHKSIAELRAANAEVKASLKSVQAAALAKDNELATMRAAKEALQASLEEARAGGKASTREATEALRRLEGELDSALRAKAAAESSVKESATRASALSAQISRLESEVSSLARANASLKEAAASAKALAGSSASASSASSAAIARLEGQVAAEKARADREIAAALASADSELTARLAAAVSQAVADSAVEKATLQTAFHARESELLKTVRSLEAELAALDAATKSSAAAAAQALLGTLTPDKASTSASSASAAGPKGKGRALPLTSRGARAGEKGEGGVSGGGVSGGGSTTSSSLSKGDSGGPAATVGGGAKAASHGGSGAAGNAVDVDDDDDSDDDDDGDGDDAGDADYVEEDKKSKKGGSSKASNAKGGASTKAATSAPQATPVLKPVSGVLKSTKRTAAEASMETGLRDVEMSDAAMGDPEVAEALERIKNSTKGQLRSWLADINLNAVPTTDVNKDVLIDLLYDNHPLLVDLPRPARPAKKTKR